MDIGIMQGRLLPRYNNRYQAFPVGYWQSEFHIARELGFAQIEFILDYNDAKDNPLMQKEGIAEILKTIDSSGVKVKSVCADYFMEAPFHSEHQHISEEALATLINNAAKLGVVDIVIPCVDQSTLGSEVDRKALIQSLQKLMPLAESKNIFLNLETDLAPEIFSSLLDSLDDSVIRVNYDIGNSASLGYDPREEFEAYGKYVSDLHIKDRKSGAGSVELGTGDAKFDVVFPELSKVGFSGNIIMQSARAESYLDDLQLVATQKTFAEKYIETYGIGHG